MPTNLALDDKLIMSALKLGRHKSKKEAVTQALTEYIGRFQQQDILKLFGEVDWAKDYDYKAARKRS